MTWYKLNDEESDSIVAKWPEEWKVSIGEYQLLDQEEPKRKNNRRIAMPIESEIHKQQEKVWKKHVFE